jgi:hypothetical protein
MISGKNRPEIYCILLIGLDSRHGGGWFRRKNSQLAVVGNADCYHCYWGEGLVVVFLGSLGIEYCSRSHRETCRSFQRSREFLESTLNFRGFHHWTQIFLKNHLYLWKHPEISWRSATFSACSHDLSRMMYPSIPSRPPFAPYNV